jgi:hypothetical protein
MIQMSACCSSTSVMPTDLTTALSAWNHGMLRSRTDTGRSSGTSEPTSTLAPETAAMACTTSRRSARSISIVTTGGW